MFVNVDPVEDFKNQTMHKDARADVLIAINLDTLHRIVHGNYIVNCAVDGGTRKANVPMIIENFLQHLRLLGLTQRKSSTWRELTALFYALKTFQKLLYRKQAVCCVDNFATSRIVKIGSPNSELHSIALKIFDFCQENSVEIRVKWIPRALNTEADLLSKHMDLDDWEISSELFTYLDELCGPFSIDRFADENNRKGGSPPGDFL